MSGMKPVIGQARMRSVLIEKSVSFKKVMPDGAERWCRSKLITQSERIEAVWNGSEWVPWDEAGERSKQLAARFAGVQPRKAKKDPFTW